MPSSTYTVWYSKIFHKKIQIIYLINGSEYKFKITWSNSIVLQCRSWSRGSMVRVGGWKLAGCLGWGSCHWWPDLQLLLLWTTSGCIRREDGAENIIIGVTLQLFLICNTGLRITHFSICVDIMDFQSYGLSILI